MTSNVTAIAVDIVTLLHQLIQPRYIHNGIPLPTPSMNATSSPFQSLNILSLLGRVISPPQQNLQTLGTTDIFDVDVCGLGTLSDSLETMLGLLVEMQQNLAENLPLMKSTLITLTNSMNDVQISILIMTIAILMVIFVATIVCIGAVFTYWSHRRTCRKILAKTKRMERRFIAKKTHEEKAKMAKEAAILRQKQTRKLSPLLEVVDDDAINHPQINGIPEVQRDRQATDTSMRSYDNIAF